MDPSTAEEFTVKPMNEAILSRHADPAGLVTVYEYEPGNGTRYVVQITNLRNIGVDSDHGGAVTLLNMPRHGSCPLWGSVPHPSYLMEKMGVYDGDAEALCALLKHHYGR